MYDLINYEEGKLSSWYFFKQLNPKQFNYLPKKLICKRKIEDVMNLLFILFLKVAIIFKHQVLSIDHFGNVNKNISKRHYLCFYSLFLFKKKILVTLQ